MNYNFVDTDLIEINENLELSISEIPNTQHKVFVIDNFLKNPEVLRDIASKQIFEKNRGNNKSVNPGWVSITNLKFEQIIKTAKYIIDNYYEIPYNGNIVTQFNLYEGGMPSKYTQLLPHVDQSFFAFQIYLNLPDECKGGTSFFQHIQTGLDHNVQYFDENFISTKEYSDLMKYYEEENKNDFETILEFNQVDSQIWKKIYDVEMKYNRFVLYPSYIFHSANIEKEWFQETKRIGLVGFMK